VSEIVNARIQSAEIGYDREVFLSVWLILDYGGGSCQGFGGYILGGDPYHDMVANNHAGQSNIAGEFIAQCLSIGGAEKFNQLPGKVIRVRRGGGWNGKIEAIGHAIEDKWFEPESRLKEMAT